MQYRTFTLLPAVIFLLLVLLFGANISSAGNVDIVYTSPVDGAKYIRPEETIIISANQQINENSLNAPGLIQVTGTLGGNYNGDLFLSPDNKTIIFKPQTGFLFDDYITVSINSGITTSGGDFLNPKSFSFTIRAAEPHLDLMQNAGYEYTLNSALHFYNFNHRDTLPADFPFISILNSNNPSYGRIFLSNFGLSDYQGGTGHTQNEHRIMGDTDPHPYLIILENSGEPYFYKKVTRFGLDFKVTRGGNIVYFEQSRNKYIMLDTNFSEVDSFECGNGYPSDHHELIIMENGHALIMSYDDVRIDMSQIVPEGNPRAVVTGLVIQELDKNKNVVFQWRSWDHVEITDATHEDLTLPKIDYIHGNSIEPDWDGNLIISSRHLDEITKINRVTGEIMWRLGGENNEFTFINDTIGFSHQHDARRVAPGRITLFDNGNFHSPPYSRAVEYELDEVNKTATLVWEFDHNKEIFGFAMGNVQRLPNGNTIIGWGTGYPNVTEVDPNGNIVYELALEDSTWTYRAFRFIFNQPDNITPENFSLSQNYPNPFNPNTTIAFEIPTQSNVTLKVYDILGREVSQLINENLNPGSYNILWNAQNLASGVYFYKIITESFTDTKKMVLLK